MSRVSMTSGNICKASVGLDFIRFATYQVHNNGRLSTKYHMVKCATAYQRL